MIHKKCLGTVARMWSDNPPFQFVDSLANMLLYTQHTVCGPNEYIHYDRALMSYHESARNIFTEDFQGDWLFMTDTDHVFAPDLLERLLYLREKHNTRVVSGIYQFKYPPHAPVSNAWDASFGKGTAPPFAALTQWDQSKDLIEVGPTGGGCLLINRDVIDEIKGKLGQQPFTIIPGLSEDYSFFWRCKELGIQTFLATRVQSHHLMPRMALSIDDYLETLPKAEIIKEDEVLKISSDDRSGSESIGSNPQPTLLGSGVSDSSRELHPPI